jgi:hypothetical protein
MTLVGSKLRMYTAAKYRWHCKVALRNLRLASWSQCCQYYWQRLQDGSLFVQLAAEHLYASAVTNFKVETPAGETPAGESGAS